MNPVIEKFFEVLSEIVPDYKNYLNPPCDPAKFEIIENLIGEELPEAFKDFYRIADGEIPSYVLVDGKYQSQKILWLILGFKLASLSEMIDSYTNDGYPQRFDNSYDDYYYDNSCYSSDADKIKTHIYFHRKWLPFAFSENPDSFLLDFAPAEKGVKGQIFVHNCAGDSDYWEEYASSFEEFIQKITDVIIKYGDWYKQNKYLWNWDEFDFGSLAVKANPPFVDDIQREKFNNLPFEWKEYFKNTIPTIKNYRYCYDEDVKLEQLNEIRILRIFFLTEERLQKERNGILPKNEGVVMEDTYKIMLQDITPMILLPRLNYIFFWNEINLSQLEFLSQYLTHIYRIHVPNIFQQKDIKILGNFKRLFELSITCEKIEDFSDLMACKDLARLIFRSSETPNVTILSQLKRLDYLELHCTEDLGDWNYKNYQLLSQLGNLKSVTIQPKNFIDLSVISHIPKLSVLDISTCENIEDFSPLANIKNPLYLKITPEQFIKALKYIDKKLIRLDVFTDFRNYQGTEAEMAIIKDWFEK